VFGGRALLGPTGELTELPIPSSWILGVGAGKVREGKGGREREGRKGREWEREMKEEGRDKLNKKLVTGLDIQHHL